MPALIPIAPRGGSILCQGAALRPCHAEPLVLACLDSISSERLALQTILLRVMQQIQPPNQQFGIWIVSAGGYIWSAKSKVDRTKCPLLRQ